MRSKVSLVVLISVLAGCAAPVPAYLSAPQAPQAARPLTSADAGMPVVATGKAVTGTPNKALLTPVAGKALLTAAPDKALIVPVKAAAPALTVTLPAATAKDGKVLTSLDAFDPMSVLAALPPNEPSAPDVADVDTDEDDGSSFSTKFLWWGWSGIAGRDRGLRAFAKEEGRMVEWLQYANGWTTMRTALTATEIPGAVALAVSPAYNRTPTTYKFLSDGLKKRSTRHLKFFRRQDIVDTTSKHLGYYQIQRIGSTVVAGYIARAEYRNDRYIAYYDGGGKFLWAYGTNYPGYGGGYGGYGAPLPDASASPSAESPASPAP